MQQQHNDTDHEFSGERNKTIKPTVVVRMCTESFSTEVQRNLIMHVMLLEMLGKRK